MPRGSHPNSRKNLERGGWKIGQSGNPSGRARGHVYASELLSKLLSLNDDGSPKFTEADLNAILDDPEEAPVRKLACRWIVTGLKSGERWCVGKNGELRPAAMDPLPLRACESLADRIEGKSAMRIEIEHTPLRTPAECDDEIMATIEAHPELLDSPGVWPSLEKIIRQRGYLLERLRPLLLCHVPKLLESVEAEPPERARL